MMHAYAFQALADAPFVFAKTMADDPHWYTKRSDWPDKEKFAAVASHILQSKAVHQFQGEEFPAVRVNSWVYWTRSPEADKAFVINRARIQYRTNYDTIASDDSLFGGVECGTDVIDQLAKVIPVGGRTLDIGCGSGWFLEKSHGWNRSHYVNPNDYVGIDPSRAALEVFAVRFAAFRDRVFQSSFENFWVREKFDRIVCLRGAANHIRAEALPSITDWLSPDGEAFVMLLDPAYRPPTRVLSKLDRGTHRWMPTKGSLKRLSPAYWLWRITR